MHRDTVFINGVKAPSVTEVLSVVRKPFLELWRGKLGNKACEIILRESQEIGTNLHAMIEAYFRGETIPEFKDPELKMFMVFKEWALRNKLSPIELESSMQSTKFGFHGSCDFIGMLNEKLVVVDWKTSSAMDSMHGVQLAAYAAMYQEETGTVVNDGLIVRFNKKAKGKDMEVKEYPDLDKLFPVFISCLGVWRYLNKDKEAA